VSCPWAIPCARRAGYDSFVGSLVRS